MKRVRVLAVDDEPLALRRLQLVLADMDETEIVGTATGCTDAVRKIIERSPEVVLLDIKMRDGTGFDVLDRLPDDKVPAVIFVTAFNDYAIRAFDISAVDYVLKPVDFERLRQAIAKARDRLAARDAEDRVAELRQLVASLRDRNEDSTPRRFETELWVKSHTGRFVRVPIEAIDWVSAEADYVRLNVGERSYLMRESIAGLQQKLDPDAFIRIHRSTLVRVDCLAEVGRNALGVAEAILTSGLKLRVGRVYYRALRQRMASRAL